jgi:hypothetical protein
MEINPEYDLLDPADVEYVAQEWLSDRRYDQAVRLMNAQHQAAEDAARQNTPGLANFFNQLAQARIDGAQTIYGRQ